MEEEPHIWEYDDAMRFVSPSTLRTVHHADGDTTLEGEGCTAEVEEGWMADTKRRLGALHRANVSTRDLNVLIGRMRYATTAAELRSQFELFEAMLDGKLEDLIDELHAKYDD